MLPEGVVERVTSYIQHQAKKSRESIADLVAHSQTRLLDTVGAQSEADALRRPEVKAEGETEGETEWCLRELMRHVVAAEASVARVVTLLASGEALPAGDRRALGMMRPEDDAPYSAIIDELRASNAAMLDAIRSMPAEPNMELTYDHPFFGPLNCVQWAVFQRIHDEDHIQHAQRIIATGV